MSLALDYVGDTLSQIGSWVNGAEKKAREFSNPDKFRGGHVATLLSIEPKFFEKMKDLAEGLQDLHDLADSLAVDIETVQTIEAI